MTNYRRESALQTIQKKWFRSIMMTCLMVMSFFVSDAQFSNVPVTGFNQDIVADVSGSAASASTTAAVDGVATGSFVFVTPTYQRVATTCVAAAGNGWPSTITSSNTTTNTGITYALQAATANNSLEISSTAPFTTSGTLNLVTPTNAASLYFVCLGGNGATTFNAQLNFSDATSQTITGLSAPDWCGGAATNKLPNASTPQQYYRLGRDAATCTGANCQYIYEIPAPLSGANYGKTINSITFTNTGATFLHILAVGKQAACAVPADQATLFTPGSITSGTIPGSFTAAASTPTGYLVVRYPNGATPTAPVAGTTYTTFQSLGAGTVVQSSNATSFTATNLSANTAYDFYIYSYNTGATCGGPIYNTSSPLTSTQTTATCSGLAGGTYSVGPTGVYTNLTAAFAAASAGMTGPVIFELQAAYVSSGETYPLTLGANPCITATNSLTVRPETGATALKIVSGNINGTVYLNGVNYVTFDGRPGGAGTVSQLTIADTVAGANAMAVLMNNDASNNNIKYCTITSRNNSASGGTVFLGTGIATGNDNNTIDNCTITDDGSGVFPLNGVYSVGSSATVDNSNNSVTNCNISNYYGAATLSNGILLASTGNQAWTITNNRFFQTATRLYTSSLATLSAITIGTGSGYVINNNVIGYNSAAATAGTYYSMIGSSTLLSGFPTNYVTGGTSNATRFIAINCAFTAGGTVSNIQGNTISNIALYTSSGATTTYGIICGIQVTSGAADIGTITGNTIGSTSANGSIYAAATTSGGTVVGIYANSGNAVNIQNNTIAGIDASGTTTAQNGGISGIDVTGAGIITISNNNIGGPTAGNLRTGFIQNGSNLGAGGTTLTSTTGSGALLGIRSSSSGSTLAINNNTVRGFVTSGTTSTLTGITSTGNLATSVTINSNLLGTATTGLVTYNFANSGAFIGINCSGATSATIHSIQNNDIRGISNLVAGTQAHTYWTLLGATAGGDVATVAGNTLTNLNVNTTGTITFFSQSYIVAATGQLIFNNNSIVTGFNRASAGAITFTTTNSTSAAGSITNYTNNNFSNITVPDNASSALLGINNTDGGTGTIKQVTGNIFSNWHGGTSGTTGTSGTINCFNITYWNGASNFSNNTVSNITGRSTITAMTIGSVINTANPLNVSNNNINNLSSIGTGGAVTGITCANTSALININGNNINTLSSTGAAAVNGIVVSGATLTNVFKNTIHNLIANGASTTTNGIVMSGGTTVNIHNNLIGNLTAPLANATTPISGILVSGGTTSNISYNTIFLNASSSGAVFGSSGIFISSTTPNVTLRNNIVTNLSTPNGATGYASSLRRSATAFTGYNTASNNNLYYSGTPSANKVIYFDGTNSYGNGSSAFGPVSSAGSFQALVTPRETSSFNETVSGVPAVTFQSLTGPATGSSLTFLHIVNGLTSQIESGGTPIASPAITDDYDGNTRSVTTPDVGADEFTGTTPAPSITFNSITPSTTQCVTTPRAVSMTATTPAGSITGVTITYNFNGTNQGSFAMTNTSGNIWEYTIPVAVPTNATVTWSATATNAAGLTATYTGTSYSDDPLAPSTVTISASVNPICAGTSSVLTAAISPATATGYLWNTGATTNAITVSPSTSTAYTCTVTALGCTKANSPFTLTANPLPTAPTGTPSTQCGIAIPGASVTSTSGLVGPQFFWYNASSGGTLLQTPPAGATLSTFYSNNFTSATLSNSSISGAAAISGGALVLQPTTTSTGGALQVNAPGFNSTIYQTDFDLSVIATGTQLADGFSYCIGDDAIPLNNSTTPTAEHGSGSKIRIGFLTYNTASGSDGKGIYIGYNVSAATGWTSATTGMLGYSTNVSWIPTSATTINSHVTVSINAAGQLTLMLGATTIFNNVQLPAGFLSANKSTWKHIFSSRSGGVAGGFAMDNLVIQSNSFGAGYTTYQSSINTPTTFYVTEKDPSTGCESSPRTSVLADVTYGDAVAGVSQVGGNNVTGVCLGGTFQLSTSQTGVNLNNYAYTWTSTAGSGITGSVSGGTFSSPTTLNVTPTVAGTYVYTVNYTDGVCNGVSTITVNASPLPTITSAVANPSTICNGSSTTLTAVTGSSVVGTIGSGTGTSAGGSQLPYYRTFEGSHKQYLYTAAELTTAGFQAGNFTNLTIPVASVTGTPLNFDNFGIRMANTTATSLTAFQTPTFTNCYSTSSTTPVAGNNSYTFTTPFTWDGISNVLLDVYYDNDPANTCTAGSPTCWGNSVTETVTTTAFTSCVIYYADNTTGARTISGLTTVSTTSTSRPNFTFSGTNAGPGTYSWQWNPGAINGNVAIVSPSGTTTYTVTATTPAGCTATQTASVTVITLPTAPTAASSTQCGYGVPTASVSSTSGNATPSFKWYSASTGGTLLQTGTFTTYQTPINSTQTFYVTEASGICESSPRTPVTVTVTPADQVAVVTNAATCIGTANPFSVSQTGSNQTYTTYTWYANPVSGSGVSGTPTGATQTFTPTLVGTYNYWVIASDGVCSSIDTQAVKVYVGLTGSVTATQILSCVNPTGLITTNVSGAGTVVNNDFASSTLPSYMTLQGSANISGGQLVITPNSGGQSGSVLIQNTTGLANNDFQIDFDFITSGPAGTQYSPFTAADGLSYSYGDDVVAGTYQNVGNAATNIGYPSGSPIGNTAEGGSGTKLKISFDPFNNGIGTQSGNNGGENYAGVYFMYNCTDYFNATHSATGVTAADNARGVLAFSPSTQWRATAGQPASPVNTTHVTITMAGAEAGYPNGSTTLTLTGTTGLAQGYVFGPVKVALPAGYLAADKSTWKHVFAARTGGNWEGHMIDNLSIRYNNFYEYSINNGASWSQTTPIVPPTSGTYPVLARYVSVPGCFSNIGTAVINAPSFTTTTTSSTICAYSATQPTLSFSPIFGAGAAYQWQSSPAGMNTWTDIIGETGLTYTPAPGVITSNTDFHCVVSCGGTPIPGSPTSTVTITPTTPTVLTAPGVSRCGPGTVVLNGTSSSGATLNWYTASTGGTATPGSSYTTPMVTASGTNFYVSAIDGTCESPRTAVPVTLTTSPSITATSGAATVCAGNLTTVSVSSANDPNYTYSWTSNPAGFTASGNGPHNVAVASTTTYSVYAMDNTAGANAGCGALSTVTVNATTNNISLSASSTPTTICSGQDAQLNSSATFPTSVGGYSFSASSGSFTPLSGGTVLSLASGSLDDGYFGAITIPFSFNYAGVSYTQFTPSTNGILTMGTTSSTSTTNNLTSNTPRPFIAPLSDDMDAISATVSYTITGSVGSRVLTVEWLNMEWYFSIATGASISYQCKLYEGSNKIEFIYQQEAGALGGSEGASIGLAGSATSSFLSLNGSGAAPTASSSTETSTINAKPATGQVYTFLPPPPSGGFTYDWSSNSNFLSSTSISNPVAQAVTGNQSYTVVVTDAGSGCTKSAIVALAVNPIPDASISNAGSVCEGFPITLGASNNAPGQSSGNTYSWSTDAVTPYSSTSSTASVTSNATVNNSGNYTVVITNSFLCTASATDVVTVNPNPVLNASSITDVINESCPGASDGSFQATATSGTAPFDYSIDGGNSSNQSGSFTALTPGTYSVQVVSDFNGCVSASTPVTITSPNLPPTVSCPGNQAANAAAGLCSAVVSYSTPGTGIPAPDVTYAFTGATTGSGTGNGSGEAFNVGTTTVTVTVSNSCGTDACSFDVVVTDTQNPVITCPANIAICNPTAQIVNFTVNATDNCSIASVVSTPASGSIFPVGTTTVNSVATDVNGNTSTCSFTVTISTPSTAPTSISTNADNNNICLGNSVVLTVNGGSLGTGAVYNWYTGSCGGTLAGTGSSLTKSPTVTTTYYVRAEGACNTTTCASVTVVVSTSPVTSLALMPFTGMPSNVCAGTVATLSIAPVSRATYYVWDVPTGSYFNGVVTNVSPFTTTTPSVTVTFGSPSGSLYNIGVQAGNACGTSVRQSQKVRGLTSVPASVSGPTTACANSTVTYSTAAVTGATSYLWTVTGAATVSGTGTTATVSFGAGYTGGTVCVAAQTTCYTSPAKCITISTSASTLNAISGTFTACPNSTLTYSVPASTGAASYTWTLPPGATGSSTTNSINVTYGAGYSAVGSICVSVTSTCGVTSAVKCKTVAPGLPSQPASISGALTGLCNQTIVYSTTSQGSGITYTWTSPGTINTGQGSTSISTTFAALSTGNVCVTASNSCGSSTARCVPVKGAPNAPGAITATPPSWCANTSGIEFDVNTASLTGTYTLSWTFPPAAVATYVIGGGNSNSLILDWKTGSGNVNVTASNACGGSTKTSTWSSTCREGSLATVSSISVSPNPTTGMLNINYTATKGSTVINVLDLAGRVVMIQTTSSIDGANATQIDLGKVAKGAYMLSVQSTQGNKQVRVVVE